MWYLSFSCWCCTDLSFLAYVAICHDIATCKYRSTCPRRLECSRTECLKNLLCTVHQKFVVYRTPQICCVQYTKNLLCTVHQKFVVYSTPKICYVQYTKNSLCTVHQKFAMYSTPKIRCVQYTKNLLCTVHQKFVVYSTPKIHCVQYTKNLLCTVHQKFVVYSTPKICCVQYTQTMILCQMAVHNVEAWYTEYIEGWWEVIYYELHNTNCRHQYNQTVVVVPEFALPIELLCWQFKEYAYAIILCIASLPSPSQI